MKRNIFCGIEQKNYANFVIAFSEYVHIIDPPEHIFSFPWFYLQSYLSNRENPSINLRYKGPSPFSKFVYTRLREMYRALKGVLKHQNT